ncbi:MAG: c-type cytochrome [Bacteroidetes bacterium]|nr:c-type cytochrome [Bacteroidota bacterium]
MRVKQLHIVITIIGITLSVFACKKTSVTFSNTTDAGYLKRPDYFPAPHYLHTTNVFSKQGFELGRKLFFDPVLSINNSISCASCHKQEYAFADGGEILSKGIDGRTGRRHTPSIFNMAWNTSFMWDGGVNHLEVMPLAPLTNPNEMGETISHIVYKLNRHNEYPSLFKEVFHRDSIDDQQMFWALAQYMSNLVSSDSKYDKVLTNRDKFTAEEQQGYNLYKANCAACHKEPLFTDYSFQNNGLDVVYTADSGRYRITTNNDDWGKFKVPTLRNAAVTYPYMHDGRFATLDDVLKHYSDGILASPTLSSLLIKNGKPGLALTKSEQQLIITFLKTLTDSTFLHNTNLAEHTK